MNTKHKNSKKTWISLLLLFLIISWQIWPLTNVTASSVEDLKAEKQRIAEEILQAEADLSDLEESNRYLESALADLRAEQKVQQDAYDKLLLELETAKKNLEAAIKVHKDAVTDLQNKQTEYEDRITSMFRIRNKSTLEVLLESKDMTAFMANMRLMSYMSSVDQDMIAQLDAAREVAKQAQINSEQTKKEYDEFVAAKEVELEALRNDIQLTEIEQNNMASAILARSEDVTNLQNQEHGVDAEIDALLAQIQREEAEKRAAANVPPIDYPADVEEETRKNLDGSEAMIYPVAGYTSISSPFGWRADPFTGTGSYMHWGVDFPAPAGTPIRASLSGTVRYVSAPNQGSTYGGSGLGNYCTITNSEGISLIYAHQTTVYVYSGQWVNQGEVIGTIGSTGYSTGPHIHFQMMVPWSSDRGIDPIPYLR